LLGYSAVFTSAVMVPAFKKGHSANLVKRIITLTPRWQTFGSRVSTALVYSKCSSNVCRVFGG